MAQVFLHGLDIVSGAQAVDSIGVTQCMKTKVALSNSIGDPLEMRVESFVLDELSKLVCKDQIICVIPG